MVAGDPQGGPFAPGRAQITYPGCCASDADGEGGRRARPPAAGAAAAPAPARQGREAQAYMFFVRQKIFPLCREVPEFSTPKNPKVFVIFGRFSQLHFFDFSKFLDFFLKKN